ncbi:MAG: SDR family oxidoreductase, partial [Pseudomonadota bacterium]
MWDIRGKVAVVTGAASGIGRETAILLAQEGCELAISDVDMEGLEETVQKVKQAGAKVSAARLDVSDKEAFYEYASKVIEDHGSVQIVVNNAGVALTATIEEMEYEDFEWLFNINFWGMVYGTKAFLPHLKKNDAAHVVNISSVFGLWAIPTQGAYNCSKFAIRGFTEALGQELAGSGVTVSSVHPGGIRTNIARKARFKS